MFNKNDSKYWPPAPNPSELRILHERFCSLCQQPQFESCQAQNPAAASNQSRPTSNSTHKPINSTQPTNMATTDCGLSNPQWYTAAVTKSNELSSSRKSLYYMSSNIKSNPMDESCYSTMSHRRASLTKAVNTASKKKNKKNLKPVKFEDGESSCVVHQLESNYDDVDPAQLWFSVSQISVLQC